MSCVINGETDKMGILYERYKIPLYCYFFKLTCGDRETSEDLVNTVFYRAIRYKSTFTGAGNFVNWLFRIARNAGLDYNKKKKSSNDYKTEFYRDSEVSFTEDEYEKREEIAFLNLAMGRLEHEEREIIVLGKIKCLKYKDISAILGISEGNVRIRMFRALRKLKDIFLKIENSSYEKKRAAERSS